MTERERHERVADLIQLALDLPQGERRPFLERKCGQDRELLAELERLLSPSDDAIDAVIETPVFQSAGEADDSAMAPDRIGRYKIIRTLGEGGMGDVYLAEQATPARKVALKLIKRGMDSKEVLARFETERQALAMMDHPGVARVYDAGTAEDGRPYFVLEHVEGLPLTKHCDKYKLSIVQRLELFIKVCEAVQHAHQKGIIHRDIKPTNILVRVGDDCAIPKVIDFGVAKAIRQRLTERTLLTEQGQLIGTPEYMSPEQAGLAGEDVDTRTDIYSLGVLLYELLTGVLPFDADSLRRAPLDDMHRTIREVEPLRPSARIASHVRKADGPAREERPVSAHEGCNFADIAAHRSTDPGELKRMIRGDLDWITMKALEKDRVRRYTNASDLAADIRRHLNHEPVLAGPPSKTYRVGKFVRRHRLAVAAGSVAAAALLAATGISVVQWRIAENATRLAEERGDHLETVIAFQSSMLQNINPASMGRGIIDDLRETIRKALADRGESSVQIDAALASFDNLCSNVNPTNTALRLVDQRILARAIETIEVDYADQPIVESELRLAIGETYRELGLYTQARPQLERALAIRRKVMGNDHPETLVAINHMAQQFTETGKYAEALPISIELRDRSRRVLGSDSRSTLAAVNNLGHLYLKMGQLAEAEPCFREALAGTRRTLGNDHKDTLTAVNNLASLLRLMGKYDEALALSRESLASRRRLLGEDHPDMLHALNTMGTMCYSVGRYAEAVPYLEEAVQRRRRVLGDDHFDTLFALNNLGVVYTSLGEYDKARACITEALERRRRVIGSEHPDTLNSLNKMGLLLMAMGKYDEALPYIQQALESRRSVLGSDHPLTSTSVNSLGVLLRRMGKVERSIARLREALAGRRRALGDGHPQTLMSMNDLAESLTLLVDLEEAQRLSRQSAEGLRRALGEEHPKLAYPLETLAKILLAKNQPEKARELILEVLEIREAALPENHTEVLEARSLLARCRTALARDN